MLDRQKGDICFECDGCAEILDTQTSNFDAALNRMRREGWKAMKTGEDWFHYCQRCKGKESR